MSLQAIKIVKEEFEKTYHRIQDGPITVDGPTFNNVLRTLRNNIECRIEDECIELPMPTCKSCGVDHDPYLACEDVQPDHDIRKDDEVDEDATPDNVDYCPWTESQRRDDIPF